MNCRVDLVLLRCKMFCLINSRPSLKDILWKSHSSYSGGRAPPPAAPIMCGCWKWERTWWCRLIFGVECSFVRERAILGQAVVFHEKWGVSHAWLTSSLSLSPCRSLAVGSKSGYKFFSLSSVDKLEQIYECSKCVSSLVFLQHLSSYFELTFSYWR